MQYGCKDKSSTTMKGYCLEPRRAKYIMNMISDAMVLMAEAVIEL
jgi:hypothetical protein